MATMEIPKRVRPERPLVSEGAGAVALALGFSAYLMGYKTIGFVGMGVGVFGLLNGNFLLN